eukprot:gene11056-7687_t
MFVDNSRQRVQEKERDKCERSYSLGSRACEGGDRRVKKRRGGAQQLVALMISPPPPPPPCLLNVLHLFSTLLFLLKPGYQDVSIVRLLKQLKKKLPPGGGLLLDKLIPSAKQTNKPLFFPFHSPHCTRAPSGFRYSNNNIRKHRFVSPSEASTLLPHLWMEVHREPRRGGSSSGTHTEEDPQEDVASSSRGVGAPPPRHAPASEDVSSSRSSSGVRSTTPAERGRGDCRAGGAHCAELAEVCAGLERFVTHQNQLLTRLHDQVRQVMGELRELRYLCAAEDGDGIGAAPRLWRPEWNEEVRHVVREEIAATVQCERSPTISRRLDALERDGLAVASELANMRQQAAQLMEQQQAVVAAGAETPSPLTVGEREELHEKIRSLVEQQMSVRRSDGMQEIKQQVKVVLERSSQRMAQQFDKWRREVEENVAASLQSVAKHFSTNQQTEAVQEKLYVLEQHVLSCRSRLESLEKEREANGKIHRFNQGLYQEFKDWMTGIESRMAPRSEVLRMRHTLEDLTVEAFSFVVPSWPFFPAKTNFSLASLSTPILLELFALLSLS